MEEIDQGFMNESLPLRFNKMVVGFVTWMTTVFVLIGLIYVFIKWDIQNLALSVFIVMAIVVFLFLLLIISYSVGHLVMKHLEKKDNYFFRFSRR